MIGRIIFIFFFTKLTFAAELNPCLNRSGPHFARNPRGCSWYFVCGENNEVVRENRCGTGYHFNYDRQMCDYRDRVYCDLDDRWKNVTCPDKQGVNVIPHPYTCLKYTICFDGFQNDRTCAPGKHFSYYDNECVDPFLADCSLDYNLCETSRETGLPTFVPNPRDCSSYFICVGETAVVSNCPPLTHFVPEKKFCLPIDDAKCTSEIPVDTPRLPDRVIIDCEGREGAKPHPEACEFYFFCADNRSYLQMCGEDTIFDVNSRRCENADKAQCVTDISTEPTTTIDDGSGDDEDSKFFSFETLIAENLNEAHESDNYSPEIEGFITISEK